MSTEAGDIIEVFVGPASSRTILMAFAQRTAEGGGAAGHMLVAKLWRVDPTGCCAKSRPTIYNQCILNNNQERNMHIVLVHVHVKPDFMEAFKQASIENASNSVKEPGIARFDVIQQAEDPTRFILVEVYKTPEASVAHKETAHYARWRDTVAEMMAEPRQGIKYANIFPSDEGW
jgi:quinol monooxygenase YgiN